MEKQREMKKILDNVYSRYHHLELTQRLVHYRSADSMIVYDMDDTVRDSSGSNLLKHKLLTGSSLELAGYAAVFAKGLLKERSMLEAKVAMIRRWNDKVFSKLTEEEKSIEVDKLINPLYEGVKDVAHKYFGVESIVVSRNLSGFVDRTVLDLSLNKGYSLEDDKAIAILAHAAEGEVKKVLMFGNSEDDFRAAEKVRKHKQVDLVGVCKNLKNIDDRCTIAITRDYTGLDLMFQTS